MISLVEANQAWLESLAYQMNNLTYKQQAKLLGGPLGLLKSFATRSAHEIADEAVNIFGVSFTYSVPHHPKSSSSHQLSLVPSPPRSLNPSPPHPLPTRINLTNPQGPRPHPNRNGQSRRNVQPHL